MAAVAILTFPIIASAQSNEIGVFVTLPSFNDSNIIEDDLGVDAQAAFDESIGYGISFNRYWTSHLSTELAAQALNSELNVEVDDLDFEAGEVNLLAFTAIAQFHLAPNGMLDPYVGGGVAHITGDADFIIDDETEERETVDLESETTWVANAGLAYRYAGNISIFADAKYIAYETRGEGDPADESAELNPLIYSAGIKFRF
ncbi:MAG TPA: OmpW family outer membrane protein [Thermoanaerobaculia bacterium]